MDQAHTKALAALQPFLYLANTTKSPSHRFLTDLILRATAAPGTYIFTELLQLPAIQSLRAADVSPEIQSYLTHLEIFSWGTFEEYKSTPNLPPLNEAQTLKLRQLSLLSIASPFLPTSPSTTADTLSYSSLLSALDLPSTASLESLITSSIYSGLLSARLSPTSNPPSVHISSVAPLRDLRPQSIPALLQILSTWESRCDAVVSDLESQIDMIRTAARSRNTLQHQRQEIIDTAVLSNGVPVEQVEGDRKSQRLKGQRLGNKRDLEEHELNEGSDEEGRMEIDDGAGGDVNSGGGMMASGGPTGGGSGGSRGTKRNRGRG